MSQFLGGSSSLVIQEVMQYQRSSQGALSGRASVLLEEREQMQASWKERGRARITVPVELVDENGETISALNVTCVVFPV